MNCGSAVRPRHPGSVPTDPSEQAPPRSPSRARVRSTADLLGNHPLTVPDVLGLLTDDALAHLAAAIHQEVRGRAVDAGDPDAVIAEAFETGFGRDGLAVNPWVEGPFVVCPGGLVGTGRAGHRCRFVSVNDTWVWDAEELVCETKRSTPGAKEGFRAVALVPVHEGLALDVVTGRLRAGQHAVDRVVSFEIRRGELIEVAQRSVTPAGMQ
jgi:hypothetical protein